MNSTNYQNEIKVGVDIGKTHLFYVLINAGSPLPWQGTKSD